VIDCHLDFFRLEMDNLIANINTRQMKVSIIKHAYSWVALFPCPILSFSMLHNYVDTCVEMICREHRDKANIIMVKFFRLQLTMQSITTQTLQ
jgi:hypothetical protein